MDGEGLTASHYAPDRSGLIWTVCSYGISGEGVRSEIQSARAKIFRLLCSPGELIDAMRQLGEKGGFHARTRPVSVRGVNV